MPKLTLPDGTVRRASRGGAGRRRAARLRAIAARVDGELRDLSFVPSGDVAVEPVDVRTDDGLHVLRHSTAHVLAQAVGRLWPGTRYAIGPAIADGFYYDLDIPAHVSAEDLPRIEDEMRAIVAADQPFVREDVPRAEALARLDGQEFKRQIVEAMAERGGRGRRRRRPSASTATTAGRTCASGRTCPPPAGSARSS